MTPLMNARLETSACVSVASLVLMSSSMAAAFVRPQQPRQACAQRHRSRLRAIPRLSRRSASCASRTGVCRQTGVHLRRQASATRPVIPTGGTTGGRGAAPYPGGIDASNNNFGYRPSDNRAAEGLAQSSEQDPIGEVQNQPKEMRSQMVTMQNRIATLEAAKGTAEVRSQPDATKHLGTDGIPLQGSHSHSRWFACGWV